MFHPTSPTLTPDEMNSFIANKPKTAAFVDSVSEFLSTMLQITDEDFQEPFFECSRAEILHFVYLYVTLNHMDELRAEMKFADECAALADDMLAEVRRAALECPFASTSECASSVPRLRSIVAAT